METSLRPQARQKIQLPYEDIEKIERVVWKEARGEGVEGRDAVRGAILNRLASKRFPNTIDEILIPSEFEPVKTHGSVANIPAPQEDLDQQMSEFADYIQIGEDASGGRTFFQNEDVTAQRGTGFTGPDPLKVGNHTFLRGYKDKEPVTDTAFSHNIEIIYPDSAENDIGMADGGYVSEDTPERMYRVDGGIIVFNGETDDNGVPMYEYVRDEQPTSNPETSLRPVARPSQEEIERLQQQYLYEEKDRLARENWEQRDQGSVRIAGMALGGLAVARKGIMTPEGEDMAKKKFQLDESKADIDDDGQLSAYEKQRGEAIQQANVDDPEQDEKVRMYHGGMMGPVDPVSGNPIPLGSTAEEVRDDIDAMLSQGEYVLPADVVKWHGLKHIMDMQQEAKMGLMAMDTMGLIQTADEEAAAEDMCPICMDAECDGCEEAPSEEDSVETPEGEEVEMASVDVSVEEPEVNETEDYQDSDYSKKTSMFGMVKKPKVTFIV